MGNCNSWAKMQVDTYTEMGGYYRDNTVQKRHSLLGSAHSIVFPGRLQKWPLKGLFVHIVAQGNQHLKGGL